MPRDYSKCIEYHGHRAIRSPTYSSWEGMIQRCTNPKTTQYHNYGGRGIKVCNRWASFINFLEDMGERPTNTTLDRIDNNGNYEPSNCRWATTIQQIKSRSTTKLFMIDNIEYNLTQLCKLYHIDPRTIIKRLNQGLSIQEAIVYKRKSKPEER